MCQKYIKALLNLSGPHECLFRVTFCVGKSKRFKSSFLLPRYPFSYVNNLFCFCFTAQSQQFHVSYEHSFYNALVVDMNYKTVKRKYQIPILLVRYKISTATPGSTSNSHLDFEYLYFPSCIGCSLSTSF